VSAELAATARQVDTPIPAPGAFDPSAWVARGQDGGQTLHLMVEGIHCAGCVRRIERALADMPGLDEGRVNLSTRRLVLRWRGSEFEPQVALARLEDLGYRLAPYDPARLDRGTDAEEKALLRAMAVAGFAAANVMLLSISVWAGAASDMGPATRTLFHWISALIALPAIAYAGQPFFASARAALRGRRLNMDVPISLAVVLAAGISLWQTIEGGADAYFDAAVTLLFFLLVGRYLDHRVRGRARDMGAHMLALQARAAMVIEADGQIRAWPLERVAPGMRVQVAAGERIPVDGRIIEGASDIDTSLITGESAPRTVGPGDELFAGTINLGAPLTLEVTAVGEDTLLAEIRRLMEAAERGRGRTIRIADRAAAIYAPVVHLAALATFIGWWLLAGASWETALLTAVSVLIITCPCALALAVPAVHTAAAGRLFRGRILLKSGDALERAAGVDTIVFDKTGTLTTGTPELVNAAEVPEPALELASALAASSRHPLARALRAAMPGAAPARGVTEIPGCGLEATIDGVTVRLGSARWCGIAQDDSDAVEETGTGPEMWLVRDGAAPVRFRFRDRLRADAGEVIARLQAQGFAIHLLSGDRTNHVARIAARLGVADWTAEMSPADKVRHIEALRHAGRCVLMVGDGLNDAAALAAANVSLSPSNAADISQMAADAVFQGAVLAPVCEFLAVAAKARRLVRINFGLAAGYNLVAVPLAMAGFASPLVAAIAMSTSSVTVILNALRVRRQ